MCSVWILSEVIDSLLGFRARCMAIDLFMSVSPKGVSRYHLTSLNKRWFIWYSSRYRNVYFHKRMQEYDQVPVLPAYVLSRNKEYMGTR